MVFMSHKTGDDQAEREAKRITRQHRVEVYMAEWDDDVVGDSNQLPDHIMNAIRQSKGFLVSVIPAVSRMAISAAASCAAVRPERPL